MARPHNIARPLWTAQEDALLIKRLTSGEDLEAVANSFPGRTYKGVTSRWSKLRPENDPNDPERKSWKRRSEKLRDATLRLIAGMSAEELAEVMGVARESIPGTERVYKTSSMERLAA